MLCYILDHVIVNDPLLLLGAVHQALFTDPVDHTGNSRCYLENFIHCFITEDIPATARVRQMGLYRLLCFRTVKVRKDTIDIDPLADRRIPLEPQLVFPQLRLAGKHQCRSEEHTSELQSRE